MKKTPFRILPCWPSSLMMIAMALTSCSKKPATPPPSAQIEAVPATQTPASPPPIQVAQQNLAASALNDKVSEAQAAMKARDFERAAAAMSASQDSLGNLNADQLAAYNNAKGALAQQIISAAAAGDPAAKAAMEKMRQDALYHR
jgi:PBP1b-binding outer membrane lipoprotein LpoB